MALLLHRHPPEEAREEVGAEHTDGMRPHLAPQQPDQRVPADVFVDLQQGVAFALVLHQERCGHPLPEFTERLIEEVPDSWRKW